MRKLKLHWQILIAIALAVIMGAITGTETGFLGITFYGIYDFLGTLFLNGLLMIVVPLIMSSIIVSIAKLGSGSDLGRLGGKTFLYYATTSTLSILVGLFFVNLMAPGIINGQPAGDALNLTVDGGELASTMAAVEGRGGGDIVNIFLRMVPTNIVNAAAQGEMLGLIFFSLVFGFFMSRIPEGPRETMLSFWTGVYETMMKITMWIMSFAPIGVFGLVAETVASTGFGAFEPLLRFFITVVLALSFHVFVTLPLMLKYLAKVNPFLHFQAMAPAILTAFSTASSSGTLPLTVRCTRENAGVSDRVTSFCLPLGATINMDGTALYECVAAIFIAQAYGLDMTFGTQFTVVLIALLTSIGVAGIPAASLVAIAVILTAIGLPIEAIGLLLVTDRVLDMFRTSINIFSDSCGAVVIGKSENETGILQAPSRA